jgi:2-amino-4-hydroxy-6-hydroxymethyldihydropteridine diphosphokinase
MEYYIGLSSNLGRLEIQLKDALKMIEDSGDAIWARSSLYFTEPVGLQDQPWFINQVIMVASSIEPDRMLLKLKKIEERMGRIETVPKGPRIIDLDILLAGDIIINTERLTVPHPEMHKRRFVLVPLVEIAPLVSHPIQKKSAERLLKECRDNSRVRLFEEMDNCLEE